MTIPPSENSVKEQLKDNLEVMELNQFQEHIEKNAVLRIDPSIDILDVAASCVEDNMEILKPMANNETLKVLTQEEEKTLRIDQEFYTIIIQPYLLIQDKELRDEFLKNQETNEKSNDGESIDSKIEE